MMTNNPNANLIEAMKEKLPLKGQLADMLMDTLYIGKEAVYRRLRGEVPFTLQESALISRKLGISLDKIIGLSFKSNAMFNINIVDYDDPFESYYNILEKYVSLINTMPDDPNSVMGTSANIIPQTLYLKHELLAKFRLFKWMYQNKYIDCKSFEELDIPPKLVNIQKDYVAMTRHIFINIVKISQFNVAGIQLQSHILHTVPEIAGYIDLRECIWDLIGVDLGIERQLIDQTIHIVSLVINGADIFVQFFR